MSFSERKNTKDGMAAGQKASVDNIYSLDGKVPVLNAIPFGLQHILAMFVANIAPILIVAGGVNGCKEYGNDYSECNDDCRNRNTDSVIPNLENRFETSDCHGNFLYLCIHCLCHWRTVWAMEQWMGAVLVGGIVEGVLGLLSKYWMKLVTPIVAATVVTAIGFSLLEVGADSFGGGSSSADFGSATNWILGTVTLVCCIVFNIVAKSYFKQLSVLFGLICRLYCGIVYGCGRFFSTFRYNAFWHCRI